MSEAQRDPNRIPVMLEALKRLWSTYPYLRLGQLIVGLNANKDPFYLEDNELLEKIERMIHDGKKNYRSNDARTGSGDGPRSNTSSLD